MHTLVGGGGQHGGYDALDHRLMKNGDADKLGNYHILSVLPDRFARFLYEFHDFRFDSLDPPPLPADQSDFDVHGTLKTHLVRTRLTELSNHTISISYNLCSEYHYVL